jgi:hypothetical protein
LASSDTAIPLSIAFVEADVLILSFFYGGRKITLDEIRERLADDQN